VFWAQAGPPSPVESPAAPASAMKFRRVVIEASLQAALFSLA
jgi:hypothetical protein